MDVTVVTIVTVTDALLSPTSFTQVAPGDSGVIVVLLVLLFYQRLHLPKIKLPLPLFLFYGSDGRREKNKNVFFGNENVFKEILFPLYTNPLFG